MKPSICCSLMVIPHNAVDALCCCDDFHAQLNVQMSDIIVSVFV